MTLRPSKKSKFVWKISVLPAKGVSILINPVIGTLSPMTPAIGDFVPYDPVIIFTNYVSVLYVV